ncbi:hypothetical protein [Paenarthrobacter nitroguajacolicus]|uniref:hypothetical protein n=1 Tax=Paenarthrobacter nitroguajacolicus TaxID=211146 RepID=UPI00248CAA60|nr:hypothetical protein [Paenarthrobacter nitroguajacolicus]MDI2032978.1 hypothetical protein [Paenarthrobacter nitroguajacolicus]
MASVIFAHAAERWKEMRDAYDCYLKRAYDQALEATGGVLVNKLGRSLHIDGLDLFTGSAHRARRYASWELIEHWQHTPRVTLEEFEARWVAGEVEYVGA